MEKKNIFVLFKSPEIINEMKEKIMKIERKKSIKRAKKQIV